MLPLSFVLAAVHFVAIPITGVLWAIVDVWPQSPLRKHLYDIRNAYLEYIHGSVQPPRN